MRGTYETQNFVFWVIIDKQSSMINLLAFNNNATLHSSYVSVITLIDQFLLWPDVSIMTKIVLKVLALSA